MVRGFGLRERKNRSIAQTISEIIQVDNKIFRDSRNEIYDRKRVIYRLNGAHLAGDTS